MGVFDLLNFRDNEDAVVRLLTQIAKNTGSLDEIEGPEQHVKIETQSVASRVGVISPRELVVRETDQLDDANTDGTITVQPGEEVVMAEWQPDQPFALLAAGATDQADAEYLLVADQNKPVGGVTGSPLGTLNSPFSFVDEYGGAISCEKSIQYLVRLDSSASASVDVAARLHAEVI